MHADLDFDEIGRELARTFHVRETEVALLQASGTVLKFVFPSELKQAGSIPISGSAIAARTALTKKPEMFNNFVKVRHVGIFESIRFREGESGVPEPQVIQKLMSAPIINEEGTVWGILQVSRKGEDAKLAGPDFTREDLHRLVEVAKVLGSSAQANPSAGAATV
jgi:hypothetical protein